MVDTSAYFEAEIDLAVVDTDQVWDHLVDTVQGIDYILLAVVVADMEHLFFF